MNRRMLFVCLVALACAWNPLAAQEIESLSSMPTIGDLIAEGWVQTGPETWQLSDGITVQTLALGPQGIKTLIPRLEQELDAALQAHAFNPTTKTAQAVAYLSSLLDRASGKEYKGTPAAPPCFNSFSYVNAETFNPTSGKAASATSWGYSTCPIEHYASAYLSIVNFDGQTLWDYDSCTDSHFGTAGTFIFGSCYAEANLPAGAGFFGNCYSSAYAFMTRWDLNLILLSDSSIRPYCF